MRTCKGEKAAKPRQELNATLAEIKQYMALHGNTSGEALVMGDSPTSDIRED